MGELRSLRGVIRVSSHSLVRGRLVMPVYSHDTYSSPVLLVLRLLHGEQSPLRLLQLLFGRGRETVQAEVLQQRGQV